MNQKTLRENDKNLKTENLIDRTKRYSKYFTRRILEKKLEKAGLKRISQNNKQRISKYTCPECGKREMTELPLETFYSFPSFFNYGDTEENAASLYPFINTFSFKCRNCGHSYHVDKNQNVCRMISFHSCENSQNNADV